MNFLIFVCYFIFAVALCLLMHEGGHFMAAGLIGEKLDFSFEWDRLFGIIPIPSFAWGMPDTFSPTQKAVVAVAGFGMEFGFAFALTLSGATLGGYCAGVTLAHFCLYPFYAGSENDFAWLVL